MSEKSFSSRIHRPKGARCDVIDFTEQELAYYTGAGLRLARFVDGVITGLFDPLSVPCDSDDVQDMVDAALSAAVDWIKESRGEIVLGLCSSCQFCEPRLMSATAATDCAHMARKFADAFDEYA